MPDPARYEEHQRLDVDEWKTVSRVLALDSVTLSHPDGRADVVLHLEGASVVLDRTTTWQTEGPSARVGHRELRAGDRVVLRGIDLPRVAPSFREPGSLGVDARGRDVSLCVIDDLFEERQLRATRARAGWAIGVVACTLAGVVVSNGDGDSVVVVWCALFNAAVAFFTTAASVLPRAMRSAKGR